MDHKKDKDEQDKPERSPLWYKLQRAERLRGGYKRPRLLVIVALLLIVAGCAVWFYLVNR